MKNLIAALASSIVVVAVAACANRNATPAPADPKVAGPSGRMMNAGMMSGHMMGDGGCPMMNGNTMMDGGGMMGGGAMSNRSGMGGGNMMNSPMHRGMMNTPETDSGCPMMGGDTTGRGAP